MDTFKKQLLGYVINFVFTLLGLVIILNITRDKESNDGLFDSVEELKRTKASNTEVVESLRQSKRYTDDKIKGVNETFDKHSHQNDREFETINKKLDIILNHLISE